MKIPIATHFKFLVMILRFRENENMEEMLIDTLVLKVK